MKWAVEVKKHVTEGDLEAKKEMESIQNDLKEKEEELEGLEELNQALIVKERMSNDELVEARKELISVSMVPSDIYTYNELCLYPCLLGSSIDHLI